MMIDYLKWDNCTVSSDEEDEESTEDEGVSHTSTTSVVNGTPAVTKARTAKISSGPTKASTPQHIPVVLPCVNCSKMVNSKDMKYCSRCKVRGYCSKECQVEEWKRHRNNFAYNTMLTTKRT